MLVVPIILGLVSSLHCIGMCGPIALMVPNAFTNGSSDPARKLGNILLYNLGRTSTYAVYGLIFGLIGRSFAWFGWQQKISISLGVLLLVFLLLIKTQNWKKKHFGTIFFGRLRAAFGRLLGKGTASSIYGIGLLNGLLPCGMVYLALAGAIASGTAWNGVGFMAAFGFGTFPAMIGLSYFGGMLRSSIRQKANTLFPLMMFLMAVLLIVRGMNLGIPYLSPGLNISTSPAVECH